MATQLRGEDLLAQAAGARGTGRSQATVVEQSRAIAEVQDALMVADRRPRDKAGALAEAMESCQQPHVAQAAFFKFSRSGAAVEGETIHLARELARCWGNIIYAVVELDRDDERGVSEMMAYAWDLQTNARSQTQFLVPHVRDKKGGGERLTEMRDIYENNANMGARRLREQIFAVLPPYLVKAAAEECKRTLEHGGGVPMPVRISAAIKAFADIGVNLERLEAKKGKTSTWTAMDIAALEISIKSIKRKEITAMEEFPSVLTGEALVAQSQQSEREPDYGRADTDHGDQNDGTSVPVAEHPAQAKANEIIAASVKCETLVDLNALKSRAVADIRSMPDEISKLVHGALDGAEERLGRGA